MAKAPFDVVHLEHQHNFEINSYYERQAQQRSRALLAHSALLSKLTDAWQRDAARTEPAVAAVKLHV